MKYANTCGCDGRLCRCVNVLLCVHSYERRQTINEYRSSICALSGSAGYTGDSTGRLYQKSNGRRKDFSFEDPDSV